MVPLKQLDMFSNMNVVVETTHVLTVLVQGAAVKVMTKNVVVGAD